MGKNSKVVDFTNNSQALGNIFLGRRWERSFRNIYKTLKNVDIYRTLAFCNREQYEVKPMGKYSRL